MVKGISIGVASDTREFSKNVKSGVIDPLEDVSDALDAVARDSGVTGNKLEKNLDEAGKAATELGQDGKKAGDKLEKAMDDARRDTSKFKDEQTELGRAMQKASREGSDSWKKNTKEATQEAGEGFQTVKKEAIANASETFSSFDGSASSFADGLQGTLGGIISDLGPLGMAAGAAGALGIGLIMASLTQAEEDTAKYKERVSELGAEFIEAGRTGETSIDYLVDKLQELATETEDVSLKQLAKVAKDAGSDFQDLAQAYSGNTKGLKELWHEADNYLDSLREQADAVDTTTSAGTKAYSQLMKQIDAQQLYKDYVGQSVGVAKEAAEAQENYAKAGGPELEQKAALVESIQSNVDDAAASWEDYQNKETGALDPAAYLAGIQARTDAANGYAANMQAAQAQLSPEAYQYLVDQGIDFAPMLQSILDSGLVPELDSQFRQAAAAGNTALGGIKSDIPIVVKTTADTAPAYTSIRTAERAPYTAKIDTKAQTGAAQNQIQQVAGQGYNASIGVDADTSSARNSINSLLNQDYSLTIVAKVVDKTGKPVY